MGHEMKDEIKMDYNWRAAMSPEIVEVGEESRSVISSSSRDGETSHDVYVAVGKNDVHVVKWALDHAVSGGGAAGTRIILVHVFPPITYIPTPVGRLSRSQLSQEQVQVYLNEESNRRKSLLARYIHLCNEAKVPVDTMLLESNATAKAILDLIPVVNITYLVMGTKGNPAMRRLRKGVGKGEYVQKNAPDFCEVTLVHDGKKVVDSQVQGSIENVPSALAHRHRSGISRPSERNFLECICFSGKFT